jgi:hypothetical protein
MVFAIDPGLARTGMSESGLTCGEPSIEEFFKDGSSGTPATAEACLSGPAIRLGWAAGSLWW